MVHECLFCKETKTQFKGNNKEDSDGIPRRLSFIIEKAVDGDECYVFKDDQPQAFKTHLMSKHLTETGYTDFFKRVKDASRYDVNSNHSFETAAANLLLFRDLLKWAGVGGRERLVKANLQKALTDAMDKVRKMLETVTLPGGGSFALRNFKTEVANFQGSFVDRLNQLLLKCRRKLATQGQASTLKNHICVLGIPKRKKVGQLATEKDEFELPTYGDNYVATNCVVDGLGALEEGMI